MRIDTSRSRRTNIFTTAPVKAEGAVVPHVLTSRSPDNNVIVQKNTRLVSHSDGNKLEITNKVSDWLKRPNSDFYLGFGGMGDALLTLAPAWNNPRASIIFFGNSSSIDFIKKFFALFDIPSMVENNIMGKSWAENIYRTVGGHPNFRLSGHLADRMNYGDWMNENKYISRIIGHAAWMDKLGKKSNPSSTKGVICIGPSGSHKDMGRQRFLSINEFKMLTNKYLKMGYTVYGIGSENDYQTYGCVNDDNCFWACSDFIATRGQKHSCQLLDMLQILNGAERVFSMDTWLKTYTLLTDIPTTVIQTRWRGRYKKYGEDITDWVFLNAKIWPKIEMAKIEELLV